MGESRRRGSYESRVALAKARLEQLRPETLVCDNCKTRLTDIRTMDARGMRDTLAVFAAWCPTCNHNTWAAYGEPEAIAEIMEFLRRDAGVPPEQTATVQV